MNSEVAGQDAVRNQIHRMWAGVAPNWARHADYLDERGGAITAVMLDRVALQPGEHVLELACGPGGAGLVAAERVGETGEVVLSDVAIEMTTIAEKRPPSSDSRTCAPLFSISRTSTNPTRATTWSCVAKASCSRSSPSRRREIQRVLRPGGRIAIAVWGPRSRNPWLGKLFDAVSELTGFPVPPPGVPGPFSLDDAEQLRAVLSGVGLTGVLVEELEAPLARLRSRPTGSGRPRSRVPSPASSPPCQQRCRDRLPIDSVPRSRATARRPAWRSRG